MTNIFFISSPYQLLSANKAKNKFAGANILFVFYGNKKRTNNNAQLDALIDTEWDRCYKIQEYNIIYKLISRFFIALILSILYKKNTVKVFIGDYRDYYINIFSRILSSIEEIVLDDGTATVFIQEKYLSKNILFEKSIKESKRGYLIYKIYRFIFRFKDKNDVPNLFSQLGLDVDLSEKQTNYYSDNDIGYKDLNESVFFIGSKYSESKIITMESELKVLLKIYSWNSNEKIYYIPHRDDSEEKIKLISEIGYIVKNLNQPLEVYFNQSATLPFKVVGFYSTALYSIFKAYKNVTVCSYNLTKFVIDEEQDTVKGVYSFYESIGMEVKEV